LDTASRESWCFAVANSPLLVCASSTSGVSAFTASSNLPEIHARCPASTCVAKSAGKPRPTARRDTRFSNGLPSSS
jgi:hypothetical protein